MVYISILLALIGITNSMPMIRQEDINKAIDMIQTKLNDVQFKAVQFSSITENKATFQVSSVNASSEEVYKILMEQKNINNWDIQDRNITDIAKQIVTSLGVNDVYEKIKFRFYISGNEGSMTVISIIVEINETNIRLMYKTITATQEIPKFYITKTACSNTGRRRFAGIAGPREQSCN